MMLIGCLRMDKLHFDKEHVAFIIHWCVVPENILMLPPQKVFCFAPRHPPPQEFLV